MKKQLVVCSTLLALASASLAAVVSTPIAHPGNSQGSIIPVTVIQNGVRKDVFTDDENYNFDGDAQGWTSHGTGLTTDTWHVEGVSPTHPAETDVWWSADAAEGGYLSSTFVYLQTPAIDLSASDGATLTFDLFYACEAPGGEPVGYDGWDGCNVWASTDGGTTWSVISGTPAYNVTSSYAFGVEFGMGTGIAQWGDTAAGWQAASFDLSAFDGMADVRLRFVMCADPAFDHVDDASMTGMQVDNIVVDDGAPAASVVWADDGSSNTGGAAEHNYWIFGDEWVLSATGGNPDGQWVCDDLANLGCWVGSPNITIVPPARVTISQDLWVDMPDQDGDNDSFLDDYFFIDYSTDGGTTWNEATHDYFQDAWGAGWYTFTEADLYNGSLVHTLTTETEFMVRYRMRTDDNSDGGDGTGLHVDNVVITVAEVPLHDLSITKGWFNYPRSVGDTLLPKVEITNLGASDESPLRASWIVYADSVGGAVVHNATFAHLTALNLPALSAARVEMQPTDPNVFKWVATAAGNYSAVFFPNTVSIPGFSDGDTSNDTLVVNFAITDANVGFLRYDSGISSGWTLSADDDLTGALVRFDPLLANASDTTPTAWDPQFLNLSIFGATAGDLVTIVVHDEGIDDDTAGALIATYSTTIIDDSDIWPNRLNRYIGTFPELKCRTTPVWIGVRSNTTNSTGVVGLSDDNGAPYWDRHTYSYDYSDNSTAPWTGDLSFFVQIGWGTEAVIPFTSVVTVSTGFNPLAEVTLSWDSPGPVDGYHVHRSTDPFFIPSMGTMVADLDLNTTTYTDAANLSGDRYYYRIIGYNGVCAE